jgi:phage/plasmid-like protein (TIGR03299 family)
MRFDENVATVEEAMELSGLNYEVRKTDLLVADSGQAVRGFSAVQRMDSLAVLGVHSDKYEVVQNEKAFSIMNEVIGTGEALIVGAGTFDKGKSCWIQLKHPENIVVGNGDDIEKTFLVTNSHDGSKAFRILRTAIRVICENTLQAAIAGSVGERANFTAKHSGSINYKLNNLSYMRQFLEAGELYYENYARQIDQLVNTRIGFDNQVDYLKQLYGIPHTTDNRDLLNSYNLSYLGGNPVVKVHKDAWDDDSGLVDHRKIRAFNKTWDALRHPTNTLPGMEGTKWALFNGVTYYRRKSQA